MAMFKITNIIVLLIVFLVTATFVNCDELVEFLTEVILRPHLKISGDRFDLNFA